MDNRIDIRNIMEVLLVSFPQLHLDTVNGPKVVMHTSLGDIKIQLFPEQAPKAVENFVTLARITTMMTAFFTGSLMIL